MKRKIFTSVLLCLALSGMSQFVPQPLNYPGPGYWPVYISISDPDHVWIGTINENGLVFPYAAKTTNGGNSWTFDSIPVPGEPMCNSICEWDTNTCFFVFTDKSTFGGTIWKTLDGGHSWANMTTTQFIGGFANFYHAFSADTGVAVGDPTGGYFEIQRTFDGGATWDRIPSANIPALLSGETGINNAYSASGSSIWFTTSKGRCYRSADRGSNWAVTEVVPGSDGMFGVCFSSEQKGVFWQGDAIITDLTVTADGGTTWDTVPLPPGYGIMSMSRVPGFDGGFIFSAWKGSVDVFFTPDLFSTLVKIGSGMISTGAISFYNATTGWLAGGESGTDEINKFTGVLTSTGEAFKEPGKVAIIPNPSAGETLVRIPPGRCLELLELRVSDMTGKVICREVISSSTGWTKLNATSFVNGIYLVEVLSDKNPAGPEKWVVNH
jgi:hypothetical protein